MRAMKISVNPGSLHGVKMGKMRIDMTANIQQIQKAALGWSIEVTPAGATKIDSFAACLAPDTSVNVTFLPGTDPMETVAVT